MRKTLGNLAGRLATVCLLLLGSLTGFAQVADGNLSGSVLDPDGASIPNAAVSVVNDATGVSFEMLTDGSGRYRVSNLAVGEYTVAAQASGFRSASLRHVAVELSKTTSANLTLAVGPVTESVTVDAAAPIDTTNAGIANIYATRMASDLAVAANPDFGYLNLVLTGAGVASSGGVGAGTGPSVGGLRPRNNNFTIEGVDNNRKDITGPAVALPQDAVAEFSVLQNVYGPEFGRGSGGQFNAVVRSGGNDIHGRVYEYFQNRYLNAQDMAFKRSGIDERTRYDQNLLGGSLGGAIVKNKLFYFGNFDYNPVGRASALSAPLYAPTSAGYAALEQNPALSQNNVGVLKRFLSPAAATDGTTAMVNGAAIPLGPLPVVGPNYANGYRWIASSDYTMSDSDQWRMRYIGNRGSLVDVAAQLPSFYTNRSSEAHLATLSELHSFGPDLTNEVRFSYNRFANNVGVPAYDYPGLDTFPNIAIQGDLGLQLGPNPNAPQAIRQNVYQIVDNVIWVTGDHEFKFGIDARNSITTQDFIQRVRGDYRYSTLENYLLDRTPDVMAERTLGGRPYHGNSQALYLYANDNWKVTRNLTLNLGGRWEYNGVAASMKEFADNSLADVPGVITFAAPKPQLNNFAPRVGFAYSPGRSGSTVIRGGFGIAYDQIFDNIGTNVRPPQTSSTVSLGAGGPAGFLAGGGIRPAIPDAFTPEAARAATSGWLPNQKLGYAVNWNFAVQQRFGDDYVLEVRYLGNRGVHLLHQTQINRKSTVTDSRFLPTYLTAPWQAELDSLSVTQSDLFNEWFFESNTLAQYGFDQTITSYVPRGNSEYHGVAAELSKRFSRNFMFKGAYTFSRLMDDSTAEINTTTLSPRRPQNFNDIRSEWARSALDRTHRLTMTWIYDTPWFSNSQNWALRNLVGNYSFSGTYTAESPQWVTPQSGRDVDLNNDAATDRVLVNPNGVPGTGTDVQSLRNSAGDVVAYMARNPNAQFIRGNWGMLANSGRNILATRGINNFDLSVRKMLPIKERMNLEIRADFYNALNRSQYTPGRTNNVAATPNSQSFFLQPGNAFFGRWDQVFPSNSRFVQLVGKFSF